jgi:serine/threonine protein kinase
MNCEINPHSRPYSMRAALEWSKDVCAALAHMHGLPSPIIHRDLKLDNVLLQHEEDRLVAKIIDFGLSAVRPATCCSHDWLWPAH